MIDVVGGWLLAIGGLRSAFCVLRSAFCVLRFTFGAGSRKTAVLWLDEEMRRGGDGKSFYFSVRFLRHSAIPTLNSTV